MKCGDCPLRRRDRGCPVKSNADVTYFTTRDQTACLAGEVVVSQQAEIKQLKADIEDFGKLCAWIDAKEGSMVMLPGGLEIKVIECPALKRDK
jgi:hypothetical protein